MACQYTPFPPAASEWAIFIVSHFVIVFGILGNTLALRCVTTCTKTRRPMKVLLFSVFLPMLVICLAMVPLIADAHRSLNTCFPLMVSSTVHDTTRFVIALMVQIEVISIAAIAVVRAVAIWAPQRPTLGIKGAVVLVLVTCTYVILSTVAIAALVGPGQVSYGYNNTTATIFNFVNTTLPLLITVPVCILLMSVIPGNKRHLVTSQQKAKATTNIDQVTRAMPAVFFSNLVFILPHSISSLMGEQPYEITAISEAILVMHLVVDPLVYMWFNSDSREKVVSSMKKVIHYMFSSCTTQAIHHTESTASCDQQEEQTPSTHTQKGIPL